MTAGRALSTIPATDIFVAQGKRREESQQGLAALDVAANSQIYLGLPDGQLWRHRDEIADRIVSTVIAHDIGQVMTLGATGYDNHPDHITSHEAAVSAVRILRTSYKRDIGLLALNNAHCGEVAVPGSPVSQQRKLQALALHESQFPLHLINGAQPPAGDITMGGFVIDAAFWDSFSPYHPLIVHGETYDAA